MTYADSASDDAVVDAVDVQVAVAVDGEHFVCRVVAPQLDSSTTVDRQQTTQTILDHPRATGSTQWIKDTTMDNSEDVLITVDRLIDNVRCGVDHKAPKQ